MSGKRNNADTGACKKINHRNYLNRLITTFTRASEHLRSDYNRMNRGCQVLFIIFSRVLITFLILHNSSTILSSLFVTEQSTYPPQGYEPSKKPGSPVICAPSFNERSECQEEGWPAGPGRSLFTVSSANKPVARSAGEESLRRKECQQTSGPPGGER